MIDADTESTAAPESGKKFANGNEEFCMLTKEENEMLTRVGPGTPAGELLRRYWLPVGVASELSAENPTQIVRILGETLVLFRDKSGRVGLLEDRCSHRAASLCYGDRKSTR